MKKWTFVLSVIAVFGFLLTACSNPPSEKVMQDVMLKAHVGSVIVVRDIKYDVFEVKQIGKYNKRSEYWPAEIHIKGFYISTYGDRDEFDFVCDEKFYKDDYGEWRVR